MMRLFTLLLLTLSALNLSAQNTDVTPMSPPDYSLETLRSFKCEEKYGDINKDGIGDIALISFVHFKEFISFDENGDTLDANQPVLAIFFGNKNGQYDCFKQYDKVLPFSEVKYHTIDYSLDVSDKGVITIDLDHFSSMGGWANTSYRYVFRYQNGDIFLIGREEDSFMRNSGEGTKTSINYLTSRKQVTTYNMFDEKVRPKEKWTRIPRKPLRLMGTWTLEEEGEE